MRQLLLILGMCCLLLRCASTPPSVEAAAATMTLPYAKVLALQASSEFMSEIELTPDGTSAMCLGDNEAKLVAALMSIIFNKGQNLKYYTHNPALLVFNMRTELKDLKEVGAGCKRHYKNGRGQEFLIAKIENFGQPQVRAIIRFRDFSKNTILIQEMPSERPAF